MYKPIQNHISYGPIRHATHIQVIYTQIQQAIA